MDDRLIAAERKYQDALEHLHRFDGSHRLVAGGFEKSVGHLSDFLVDARSVVQRLTNKSNDAKRTYENFLEGLPDDERGLFHRMKDLRDEDLHERDPGVIREWEKVVCGEKYRDASGTSYHGSTYDDGTVCTVTLPTIYIEFDKTRLQAPEACRRYLEILRKLLNYMRSVAA